MKRKILVSFLLLFLLTACGKKDNDVIDNKPEKKHICNEISNLITEYESETITFKDFKNAVTDKYNEICKEDNTEECQYISSNLINNDDAMLGDNPGCSIYKEQELIDVCIKDGETLSYLEPIIQKTRDGVVYGIKEKCGLVKTEE